MDFGLTWFDFAAFAIVGLSAVMAFARGLIREVFSIIAFIAGLLGALVGFFMGITRPVVESFTPLSGFIADLAGGLFIFLVIFIVITVVTSSVAKQFHQSTEIGSFDRAAGWPSASCAELCLWPCFCAPDPNSDARGPESGTQPLSRWGSRSAHVSYLFGCGFGAHGAVAEGP
ncbi:MAG: CvpA family protein [Hyphomonadaceae bacterium]